MIVAESLFALVVHSACLDFHSAGPALSSPLYSPPSLRLCTLGCHLHAARLDSPLAALPPANSVFSVLLACDALRAAFVSYRPFVFVVVVVFFVCLSPSCSRRPLFVPHPPDSPCEEKAAIRPAAQRNRGLTLGNLRIGLKQ